MSQPAATPGFSRFLLYLLLALAPVLLLGCAQMERFGMGSTSNNTSQAAEEVPPEPYHPAEFRDLLLPAELTWARDKSMVVNTESYAGGVLYFSGRVEVNSLTDFFVTTMPRNNWKLVGSVKYKDVLLAFTKPHKTCTIIIQQASDFSQRADVSIYITEDIAESKGGNSGTPAKTTPFSF